MHKQSPIFSPKVAGLCLLLVVGHCIIVRGAYDPSFDPEILGPASVSAILPEPGGKVYVSGTFTKVGDSRDVGHLIRLNADGTLDESFTLGKTINGSITQILPLRDGRICLLGSFTTIGGDSRPKIAILAADGSLDPTFAPASDSLPDTPTYATLDSQGRVLIAMAGGAYASREYTGSLVSLNANGSLDSSFIKPTVGARTPASLRANILFSLQNGKILLCGNFETCNGISSPYVTLLNADGTTDSTFKSPLKIVSANISLTGVLTGAKLADGSIVLGGTITEPTSSQQGVVKFKSDLTVDQTFHPPFPNLSQTIPVLPFVRRLAADSQGRLALIGAFPFLPSVDGNLQPDGVLFMDAFGNIQPDSASLHAFFADTVATDANNQIFLGHSSPQNRQGMTQTSLETFEFSGQPTNQLEPLLQTPRAADFIVMRSAGQGALLGGALITEVQGSPFTGLAAVHTDGSSDPTFKCEVTPANGATFALPLPGDRYLIGGSFSAVNGVESRNVAVIDAHGKLLRSMESAFAPDGPVTRAALLTDGRIAITGSFSHLGSTTTYSVAVLDTTLTNTLVDTTFSNPTSIQGTISGAAGLDDGSIVIGGYFSDLGGQGIGALAKLTSTGALDPTFNPLTSFTSATVTALAADSEGRIIISGTFSAPSGGSTGLMRVLSNGLLDSQFKNPAVQNVTNIQIGNDFLVYVMSSGIRRFLEDGDLDSSFNLGFTGGTNFALAPPDRIYVCGSFTIITDSVTHSGAGAFSLDEPIKPILKLAPTHISAYPSQLIVIDPISPGTSESYVWMHNGEILPEQTTSTLALAAEAGAYSVTATNAAGSTTVSMNLFTDKTPPPPTASPAPDLPTNQSPSNSPTAFADKPRVSFKHKKLRVQGRVSDDEGVRLVEVYYRGKRIEVTRSRKWKVRLSAPISKRMTFRVIVTDAEGHRTKRRYSFRNPEKS